jgi:hypothetical protein
MLEIPRFPDEEALSIGSDRTTEQIEEFELAGRQSFAGYWISRLEMIEDRILDRKGGKRAPQGFLMSMSDGEIYAEIQGQEKEVDGGIRRFREVRVRGVHDAGWQQEARIFHAALGNPLADNAPGKNAFTYRSKEEYKKRPDGEKGGIPNNAHAAKKIDTLVSLLEAMSDDIEASISAHEALVGPSLLPDEPIEHTSPYRAGDFSPNGIVAQTWLREQARQIPLPADSDKKAIKSARIAESEKPLSEPLLGIFGIDYLGRIAAIEAISRGMHPNGSLYYTGTRSIFELRGMDEVDDQGNRYAVRNIRVASIPEGETIESTIAKTMEDNDYPWQVQVWVQQKDGKTNIGYFDKDEEFRWGERRKPDQKREKIPVFNTPRAVEMTGKTIAYVEDVMGIG